QQPFETVVARRCRRHVAYRSGSSRMSRTSTSGANLPDDLTEATNPAAPQSSEGFQDSDLPNGGPASWQRNSCRSGASYVAYPLASLYVVCTPACCGGGLRLFKFAPCLGEQRRTVVHLVSHEGRSPPRNS